MRRTPPPTFSPVSRWWRRRASRLSRRCLAGSASREAVLPSGTAELARRRHARDPNAASPRSTTTHGGFDGEHPMDAPPRRAGDRRLDVTEGTTPHLAVRVAVHGRATTPLGGAVAVDHNAQDPALENHAATFTLQPLEGARTQQAQR
ncbi:hypothetical protein EJB05_19039, partial [Eragrostis curvula]